MMPQRTAFLQAPTSHVAAQKESADEQWSKAAIDRIATATTRSKEIFDPEYGQIKKGHPVDGLS